jgi:hypothetical protein
MRARIRARLQRLECRVAATDQGIKPWLGHLKRLLREYQGERHAIVARELPKQGDQEWVGFEEVPGPDPDPPEQLARGIPQRIDVMFVGPYPRTEEDLEALGDQPAQASVLGKPRYVPGPGSSAS